jgi:hypothetical protein
MLARFRSLEKGSGKKYFLKRFQTIAIWASIRQVLRWLAAKRAKLKCRFVLLLAILAAIYRLQASISPFSYLPMV